MSRRKRAGRRRGGASGSRTQVQTPEPSGPLNSRLLPIALDEKRLARIGTFNVLDFGRVSSASLEWFNRFSCRLCVADTAEALLAWSRDLASRLEEPPSQEQTRLELDTLLASIRGRRYDIILLWDTLNHLHEYALPVFGRLLQQHVSANFRGHGFMLHKRGAEQQLRQLGLSGAGQIAIHSREPAALYAHNRQAVNDALGRELRIEKGVLHSDGRLEFLIANTSPGTS